MIATIFKKIFGTRNERLLRQYQKRVAQINLLENKINKLSDQVLRGKTYEFKERFRDGESLDLLLPEAFAVVREVSLRSLDFRHFDVQLIGGMVLHDGKISEMRTGEGKTLSATLPAYLNAITEKGVHVITVNDYLAERDANWMRPIYEFLDLTVGINLSCMSHEEKKKAYAADITYGTNNEFGFDYLRDNMAFELDQCVQRPLHYAIVDEVDSILIDEARTPLIISGAAEKASDLYDKVDDLIPKLKVQKTKEFQEQQNIRKENCGDFTIDEKNRQVVLTEEGHQHVEELMLQKGILSPGDSLYDISNITLMYYLNNALRAHMLYQSDIHYVVKNNEVIIVDEHTGRLMEGRRWSEGLHQAIEVKEGVPIQLENQTLATITFQNYFRLYEKLSGMTGTADTEGLELQKVYGLEVVIIPTNKPMIRDDLTDIVYMTLKEKYEAILEDIKDCIQRKQPVLVGTASIESSEKLSKYLKKLGIKHEVLNAKHNEREAGIIANAGRPEAITIATNMAGRGTDIVLGGSLNEELAKLGDKPTEAQKTAIKDAWKLRHDQLLVAGGLHVLGTERHESRRIDNQLRGRSGRQGDPGSSQFYLSFEDSLLRVFAGGRIGNLIRRLGLKKGEMIQHSWIMRAIENAQRRLEGLNFDMRKQLLEYDDVANDQRKVIYQQRLELLKADDISKTIQELREEVLIGLVADFIPLEGNLEQRDIEGLEQRAEQDFGLRLSIKDWLDEDGYIDQKEISKRVLQKSFESYKAKEVQAGSEVISNLEKKVILQILDSHWKDHLASMDHLRQSIYLRGYAQKNPLQEYKRECFKMFTIMLNNLKYEVISNLSKIEVSPNSSANHDSTFLNSTFNHGEVFGLPNGLGSVQEKLQGEQGLQMPFVREQPKIGRNDLCPCGSLKKYKQCHGKLA